MFVFKHGYIPELFLFFISFTFDFQDNLMELAKTRKRIYDDGDIFV